MNFEKLGSFYLGKEYDVEAGRLLDQLLMYDARDLTTHAVCVGMTGSGKTGLCIDLLEEAAIDQVPAIIIDPKGDITNLLLQFPELRPSDFRPWINTDEAQRSGLSQDEYAAKQADMWRDGLASWGQDSSRIRRLSESAEYTIFTPGSEAGVPVSILRAFSAPTLNWDSEAEVLRERIGSTVSALLGLTGLESDPLKSREHILLANLFEHFWRRGEDLDLPKLIMAIQNPPISRLGVFEVDTFFPPKDRFGLAMSLNNILASPSFATWLQGEALDIGSFLATPEGLPRHSIFHIAHLNEAERAFFVAMLLNEIVSWMRSQSGTTSLRALIYMDEIFGFFPPVAEPPSKKPMLTLLKQARAFGVGVVLATQNPVDLDYKGLTNAGTWFIGRLQTDRDKKRVLDGLDSASAQAGRSLSRSELSRLISALDKRVFLMHNIHEDAPVTFQTRWAMSYLRGPMTRPQIQQLMTDRKLGESSGETSPRPKIAPEVEPPKLQHQVDSGVVDDYLATPPNLSPKIEQVFFSTGKDLSSAVLEIEAGEGRPIQKLQHRLLYKPVISGAGRVHFVNRRRRVDECREFALVTSIPSGAEPIRWDDARDLGGLGISRLYRSAPESGACFQHLPDSVNETAELKAYRKDLADHLYRTSSLDLFFAPSLKTYSGLDETERDFRQRLMQAAREARDEDVEKLNRRFESRLRRAQDRLRKAELALGKKESTASARNREFMVSVGESLLGMFLGRRSMRTASSSLGKYRMKSSAKHAIEEAEERIEALEREMSALEDELKAQTDTITERWDQALENFEIVPITPRRTDIEVDVLAVGWEPYWAVTYSGSSGHQRERLILASSASSVGQPG